MADATPKDTNGDLSGQLVRAIFELHEAVGELRQAVKTLTTQSEHQVEKLDEISRQIDTAKTVLWIAGGALSFLAVVGVFMLNKIWDIGYELLKHHAP